MTDLSQVIPRVLIIHTSCIYEQDAYGLFFRDLFGNWPKTHLAQIYTGGQGAGSPFFGHVFKLGIAERRLGHFFYRVKPSLLSSHNPTKIKNETGSGASHNVNRVQLIKYRLARQLVSTGVWEVVFAPQVSDQLEHWVREFAPDVMYMQGGLGMAWLALHFQERWGIPLIVHPVDDWPNSFYHYNPVMRRVYLRTTQRLFNQADIRIGFSERMAESYHRQFGRPFDTVIMHGDDRERFAAAVPKRVAEQHETSIVYSGGLGYQRWQSLLDLCDVAKRLKGENIILKITAFVGAVPTDVVNRLAQEKNLHLKPALAHEQVPSYLKGADILLLPEPFDEKAARDIRYSISTKAHLYMMSQKPILVYGSPEAGVVEYALQEKWGYVVGKRDLGQLTEAVHQLSLNGALQARLVAAATDTAARRHTLSSNRAQLLGIMQQAISSRSE